MYITNVEFESIDKIFYQSIVAVVVMIYLSLLIVISLPSNAMIFRVLLY